MGLIFAYSEMVGIKIREISSIREIRVPMLTIAKTTPIRAATADICASLHPLNFIPKQLKTPLG